jgi:hypothetical protein
MAEYDYKCVSVPRSILTGKAGKDLHEEAVRAYEGIIRDAAKGGWELDRNDTVTSYQKAGCLPGLLAQITGGWLGKTDEEIDFKLLIFKKQIS